MLIANSITGYKLRHRLFEAASSNRVSSSVLSARPWRRSFFQKIYVLGKGFPHSITTENGTQHSHFKIDYSVADPIPAAATLECCNVFTGNIAEKLFAKVFGELRNGQSVSFFSRRCNTRPRLESVLRRCGKQWRKFAGFDLIPRCFKFPSSGALRIDCHGLARTF